MEGLLGLLSLIAKLLGLDLPGIFLIIKIKKGADRNRAPFLISEIYNDMKNSV